MTLEIKNLHVEVDGKEILKGINLTFEEGKTHIIMGPNGSGKSTLANTIMGNPKYTITKGSITLNEKDITKEKVHERAKQGLFLSFQYPAEITGVTLTNFLRTALRAKTGKKLPVLKFHKLLGEKMNELDMPLEFRSRYVNENFSGGEKKKAEMLQMLILEPKFAILDEIDSGADIDAIKIIAQAIKKAKENNTGIIGITHYNRILQEITPDKVSILYKGKIVQQGGKELAEKIEQQGFEEFTQ